MILEIESPERKMTRCYCFILIAFFIIKGASGSYDVLTTASTTQNIIFSLFFGGEIVIPKSRLRGDTYSQLLDKARARRIWKEMIEKQLRKLSNTTANTTENMTAVTTANTLTLTHTTKQQTVKDHRNKSAKKSEKRIWLGGQESIEDANVTMATVHRRRRWDYDSNYNWENGGKDYVIPGQEPRKETKFEQFAKNWQKHAIKVIFLFSLLCMCCCCCLAICKKFCSKVCETVCWHCKDWRDICLQRDPTWRKARKFADDYGIELSYDQYKQVKQNYEEGFRKSGHEEYHDLSGWK